MLRGDLDGDGKITMNDLLLLRMHLNDNVSLTPEQISAADVNKDGNVDYEDLNLLYDHLLFKATIEPDT